MLLPSGPHPSCSGPSAANHVFISDVEGVGGGPPDSRPLEEVPFSSDRCSEDRQPRQEPGDSVQREGPAGSLHRETHAMSGDRDHGGRLTGQGRGKLGVEKTEADGQVQPCQGFWTRKCS